MLRKRMFRETCAIPTFSFFFGIRSWRLGFRQAFVRARIVFCHLQLNVPLAQWVPRTSASVIRPRGITAKASTATTFQSRKWLYISRLSVVSSPAASASLHSKGSQRRCWDCQSASGSMGKRVMPAKRARDACGIFASICSNLIRLISECNVSQGVAECKAGFNFGAQETAEQRHGSITPLWVSFCGFSVVCCWLP
jgi:hypothetical protein